MVVVLLISVSVRRARLIPVANAVALTLGARHVRKFSCAITIAAGFVASSALTQSIMLFAQEIKDKTHSRT